MRRSTTSAGTDAHASRRRIGVLLVAQLICALLLVGTAESAPAAPQPATAASSVTPIAPSTSQTLPDGRTVRLVGLDAGTAPLLARIADHLDDAADAVTAFWGPQWPRKIIVVAAGSDAQFDVVAGGDSQTAATTKVDRITFAPGAAAMSDDALRIVVRHELFHVAARHETAADAPRWLTEGVADFVARPGSAATSPDAVHAGGLPTDADLAGPDRSSAYDRAWLFTRFVADRYGVEALRELYVRACAPGHPDVATAVADTLGDDFAAVLTRWDDWMRNR
ncbi:peptidase [Mycolicibacterium sp. XJ1819]